jgi:hypothetical protein
MSAHTVYELRNYAMQAGQRDVLIDLFEREFIESQEALGSRVVATFRSLDDPDRFVWIRSFENMTTRAAAMEGFYTGPVWQSQRNAANATIADSDNVLQLRPLSGDATRGATARPGIGAAAPTSLILAETYFLADRQGDAFAQTFAAEALPLLRDIDRAPFATFTTEHAPNSYPRLPVRENETVFVALTRFDSTEAHRAQTERSARALNDIAGVVRPFVIAPTEKMRLQPTARSLLR